MVSVDDNGVCAQCRPLIYPEILKTVKDIEKSQSIIESSKNWKTKLTRYNTIEVMIKGLLKYEEKGIQKLFTQPIPQCLREIDDDRRRMIEEVIQETERKATDRAEVASTARGKINAANKGIQDLHKVGKEVGDCVALAEAFNRLKAYAHEAELGSCHTAGFKKLKAREDKAFEKRRSARKAAREKMVNEVLR